MSDYPKREMTAIKCSDCGADAEIPFVPTAGRPVYCRNCYQKNRAKPYSVKR